MSSRHRHRIARVLAPTVPLALGAGLLIPQSAASAEAAAPSAVTVRIDPSYQQQEFQGWGTSLVWFANATGGYPDPVRRRLVDMLFGKDGLDLNIARYNIGGGNAPDVRTNYMKAGATMPGFWKAPAGTTQKDRDWWNPNDPADWNWDADANQRWWVDQIKDKVTTWEAFSNSPPWFQTVSGYVSGGFDANTDQIRADRVDAFAAYLVRVTEELEKRHGITFDTIDPLNEPNTNYWGTQLGADGQPTGGRQEGAHAGPGLQQKVVLALDKALAGAKTDAAVSAMDETNPGIFTQNWNTYGAEARAAVDQLNVHTYGTGMRTSARDIAKGADRKLWMSEVEGTWGTGTDFTSMEPGLGIAGRMVDDMRELEPSAWVFWQPIEDAIPQAAAGKNWGSIHVPFNCTAADTLETCPIKTNSKFHTIRNFTHYIRPGDHFVKTDDPSTVAAVKASGSAATAVHVNSGTTARSVTLDLSRFGTITGKASVTPVVTSADGALVQGAPVRVTDRRATLTVPAKSVTTFLVSGVSGVAKDAALIQPGHVYRLQGTQSGKSLTPSDDGTGVVIRTTNAANPRQLWSVRQLTPGTGNRERFVLTSAATGKRLAVRDNAAVLENPDQAPGSAAQWILSTTGDGSWTFVNAATGRLLDVTGQSSADGTKVSTYTPTSAANQRWAVTDETALRTEPAKAFTVPGLRPELPNTVTPVLRDGARGALPVVWNLPSDRSWRKAGTVRVRGAATDALGRVVPAKAVVTVDTIASTLPGRAKTYVDGQPELPATVVGVGRHGGRTDLPVTWDPVTDRTFDAAGTVTLRGVAGIVGGGTADATARVQVTAPVATDIAPDPDVSVAATFTESGYSAEGLRNGDLSEKAWSNWKPGNTKNASDTITFTLPKARDLSRVVAHFYRDGSSASFPESLKVQVRAADSDLWSDASDPVPVGTEGTPVIDVPLTTGPVAEVRVVMTARQGGYLTMSEIEVYAKSPGVSADSAATSVEVAGVPVASFDPGTTDYQAVTGDPARAAVTATARDPYANVAVETIREHGRTRAVVTVTGEDGTRTTTYRITLVRR
ncbi:glycoside hydrolase [Streptomyces sp. NRRL WC-3618]|uniref:glycoside hydrolase n=1 Tax=Streptomyces sp. NRRL WC-3618 TaxID=1519490 RepID=UPI000A5A0B43|nr:glycoside hydrolase [Streptomyces sp. NRRL WC-3618]